MGRSQKLDIILENKVIDKLMLTKNVNNKKCAPKFIFFNEKNQNGFGDFWHRKLTLKVKFWYFLTAPHYSNFQNLVISFEYSWFLDKNLSNFVSLPSKLHNRECHKLRKWHFLWPCTYSSPTRFVDFLSSTFKLPRAEMYQLAKLCYHSKSS